MIIDANDIVKVTLTEAGARIFNAQYHGTAIPWKYRPAHKYGGDTLEVELWSLMKTFGPHIYMGMPEVPFLKNKIEVVK